GVTCGSGNELLFLLEIDTVGGLFAHDVTDGFERRLYHKQGFRARYLVKHPTKDLVAMSIVSGMESHLALTDTQGRSLREITEGDCVDECPSWIPGGDETLVYQSAGIARNARGLLDTVGPYRIERLDTCGAQLDTLMENDRFDYLNPRMDE